MNIKEKITKLAGGVYRWVYKEEMSPAVADFVLNLSWVGAGSVISTGLLAIFSIVGGRLLGPEEYGKYTLIQSVAMFLIIPMMLGFNTAMLKYGVEKDELPRQKIIVSTTYIIIAVLVVVSSGVMLLLTGPLAKVFATTPELFRYSIAFAVLCVLFTVANTTLRSVNRMRAFAVFQPVYGVILLIFFLLFIILKKLTFETMVVSMMLTWGVTTVIIHLLVNRHYFSFKFNTEWARTLSRFSLVTVIGGIAATFYGNIGRIIIARYMSVTDVGIYGAYITATMSVATILWGIFNMVFFPTASQYTDKRPLFRRINRLVPFLIILGMPFTVGSGYIILLLYGGAYEKDILLLVLFAAASISLVVHGIYSNLLASAGTKGAFITSLSAVIIAIVSVVLNLLMVPIIGITGAAAATITAYLAGTITLLWQGWRDLNSQKTNV